MGERRDFGLKKKSGLYRFKQAAFAAMILLAAGIIFFLESHTYHVPTFNGTVAYQEPVWYFGEQNQKLLPTTLNDQHLVEPGKTYVLTTTLTYDGEGDRYPSALITIGNYDAHIYLDGEEVFRHTRDNMTFPEIQSLGGVQFSVPLGQHCRGRELTMVLKTPMDYATLRILPGVRLGDYASQFRKLFCACIPSMMINAAIAFVAVVLAVLGSPRESTRWGHVHFAVFAGLIVIYRATQDLLLLYVWGNPFLAVILEFFSVVAFPIPLLLSYRYELAPRCTKAFHVMIVLSCLNLAVQMILHLTGTVDVVRMLPLTHLWLLICTLAVVILVLEALKQGAPGKPFLRLIPILAGGAMDFISFYWRISVTGPGSFFPMGNYVSMGLLVSLVIMVWQARKEQEEAYLEQEKTKLLEKMAYEDALTGLKNRAAFTKEIERIRSGELAGHRILAVAGDLNDLKKTNDTRGHVAGDELIRRAASLLSESFQDYGTVYRIGGDEFFAFLYDVSDDLWQQILTSMKQENEKRNKQSRFPLSIALGYAFMEEDIGQCIQTADKRMYEDKSVYHGGRRYAFAQQ